MTSHTAPAPKGASSKFVSIMSSGQWHRVERHAGERLGQVVARWSAQTGLVASMANSN